MFKVEGGIFTNTDFSVLETDTKECYGPFETYAEAYDVWQSKTWSKVDTCCHRLRIVAH